MGLQYKRILVIGATSGIGLALSKRFVQEGAFVVVTGRRQERLDEFVNEVGENKAAGITFNLGDLEKLPSFIKTVTTKYPDIDLVFLNAGIQRPFNFKEPESVDMSLLQTEINTNYIAPIAFTKEILPFLLAKKSPATILYTTSNLGIVPLARVPNYSGSKAGMHAVILSLRHQLKDTSVKIQELLPPAVQTELHDEKHQPGLKNGSSIGMPLVDFTEQAYAGIAAGEDSVFVGPAHIKELDMKRQEMFSQMNNRM